MKNLITALAFLAIMAVFGGCMDSNKDKSGGTCSTLEGTWEGDEVDEDGYVIASVEMGVHNDRVTVTVSDGYSEEESVVLSVSCDETANPHRFTGTITDSNIEEAKGMRICGIYQVDAETAKVSGLRPGSNEYPDSFSAGYGQRLIEVLRTGDGDTNAKDNGGSSSETEVQEMCSTFCDKAEAVNCPFIDLMGGILECKSFYCDMSLRSADCLKADERYFSCANEAEDVCYDCRSEFSAKADCDAEED